MTFKTVAEMVMMTMMALMSFYHLFLPVHDIRCMRNEPIDEIQQLFTKLLFIYIFFKKTNKPEKN